MNMTTIHTPSREELESWCKRLPKIGELTETLVGLKKLINDDGRIDSEDTLPGMEVTIGWTPTTGAWDYQTGDNSLTGGAYGHPYWAVIPLYRRANCKGMAREIRDQLTEQLPW